jgi:hypothetical protein
VGTKIQLYDLETLIQNLINDLKTFQGNHETLLKRLQDISINDLDDSIKEILQDLLQGKADSNQLTIARINELETQISDILDNLSQIQSSLGDNNNQNIHYEYDENDNVVKEITTGDNAYTTEYFYSGENQDILNHSIKTIILKNGDTLTVTEQYQYAGDNITSIVRIAKLTPKEPETPIVESAYSKEVAVAVA